MRSPVLVKDSVSSKSEFVCSTNFIITNTDIYQTNRFIYCTTCRTHYTCNRKSYIGTTYGFHSFGDLLEYAAEKGLADIEMDERSGGYVVRSVSR